MLHRIAQIRSSIESSKVWEFATKTAFRLVVSGVVVFAAALAMMACSLNKGGDAKMGDKGSLCIFALQSTVGGCLSRTILASTEADPNSASRTKLRLPPCPFKLGHQILCVFRTTEELVHELFNPAVWPGFFVFDHVFAGFFYPACSLK